WSVCVSSLLLFVLFFFFYCSRASRALHSFPTRRSSDLRSGSRRRGRRPTSSCRRRVSDGHCWRAGAIKAISTHGHSPCDRQHLRSEEHTSELQSRSDLVCRLLLEKKKKKKQKQ